MIRRLAVSIAAVVGGLLGLQAHPALWTVLEAVGIVADPTCRDVVVGDVTPSAMCMQPLSVEVVPMIAAVIGAATLGVVAWRLLQPAT